MSPEKIPHDPDPNEWFENGEEGTTPSVEHVQHPDDVPEIEEEDEEVGGDY